MKKHVKFAMLAAFVLGFVALIAGVSDAGYTPAPTGTGFVTVDAGVQNAAAMQFPSGTGFYYAANGVLQPATKVPILAIDTTGTLPLARGGTGLTTAGQTGSLLTTAPSGGLSWAFTANPALCGHRLTAMSNAAVPTTDVPSTTVVYVTPYNGSGCSLYTGSGWVTLLIPEIGTSLSGLTASTGYDVFLDYNGGAPAVVSVSWGSGTTRGTPLSSQDGVPVQAGNPSRRYVGSFRIGTTTGQTIDTVANRSVYSATNRVLRHAYLQTATGSWTFGGTTGTFRPLAGSTTGTSINVLCGLQCDMVADATLLIAVLTSSNTFACGIGIDSQTVNSAQIFGSYATYSSTMLTTTCSYRGPMAHGYHAIWHQESTSLAGATFLGNSGYAKPGMIVDVEM